MTGSLQEKNGKLYAVLNFKDEEGKRAQKWIPLNLSAKGNKRKAELMLQELLVRYQGLDNIEPVNMLLSKYIENWIEYDRPNIAVTTYDQYRCMLELHIAPYFDSKGITLSNVTPGDLEDYYRFKQAEGLNPNTVIKHHAVIRTALQHAVKHRYLNVNPADLADKPVRIRYEANEPYNVEEITRLLYLTRDEPIAVVIFLAAFYGLRRSEILGLRWSSIDFNTGWIYIQTTVVKEKVGENILSVIRDNTTKTQYSRRALPLCPYTYNYLQNVRQQQLRQQYLCGESYNKEYLDFVCVDAMGVLLQPDFVTHSFQKLLKKYGLREIRFHDLRHSCATIMLYLGYSLKDIQTWLGHSSYNFTANTYIHTSKESHMQMAETYSQQLPPIAMNPLKGDMVRITGKP